YIRHQMEALTEQAREMGDSTSKAANDAAAQDRPRADLAAGTRKKIVPIGTYCAPQYLCCIAPKRTLYQFQQRRGRPDGGGGGQGAAVIQAGIGCGRGSVRPPNCRPCKGSAL